ncbi:hypothetical protein Ddye_001155 [Dipteronia dyeriana]|uniref:RNase H type-1 domain-containing protein n=1 Tax=Dipteronia dyeriana TaxID=168575 RepID=A0AAD9XMX5_9ROSI|nr:hypothetical protein Ddye_001155 [Dipteronia dyeriana]
MKTAYKIMEMESQRYEERKFNKANADVDETAVIKSCLVFWNPPAFDWVKLNVHGSMIPELGSISAGGVVRDHRKNWLIGFALNKGTGSVLEAELWGILGGLKLVWKNELNKVFIMVFVMQPSDKASILLITINAEH